MRRLKPAWMMLVAILIVFGLAVCSPFRNFKQTARLLPARLPADPQAAYTLLQNLIHSQPGRKDLRLRLARVEARLNQMTAAVADFEASADLLLVEDRLKLLELYRAMSEMDTARSMARDLANWPGLQPGQFERLIRLQWQMGDWSGARYSAASWILMDPENSAAWRMAALAAVPFEPPVALDQMARAAALSGSPADQSFQTDLAAALAAADPAARQLAIGRALGIQGEWLLARQVFETAAGNSPLIAEAWALLGQAQMQLGEDALAALSQAVELDPDSPMVLLALADYWLAQRQPQAALVYLEQAAAAHPEQGIWQVRIGQALTAQGDLIGALARYQQAAELEPDNVSYWSELAVFSAVNGMNLDTVGLNAARRALLLQPDDPATLDLMGWTLAIAGEAVSAESFLRRAVAADPAYALAHLHLAQLLITGQRFSEARAELRIAIELDGSGVVGQAAERLLADYWK